MLRKANGNSYFFERSIFKLFNKLAQYKVNVDIILQSVGRDGTKDITFTVTGDQCAAAIESIQKIEEILKYKKLVHEENVCKVSIVGTGMETHPGVASRMFEALYDANIKKIDAMGRAAKNARAESTGSGVARSTPASRMISSTSLEPPALRKFK